jgi:hypothetical protein
MASRSLACQYGLLKLSSAVEEDLMVTARCKAMLAADGRLQLHSMMYPAATDQFGPMLPTI